ncbi:MAG: DUF3658 domain-containing protein [Azonexus sp.]
MTTSNTPNGQPAETNLELVASLTGPQVDQINTALVAATDGQWRKVALVVARAMQSLPEEFSAVPDVFFARQIRVLVSLGELEGVGNLRDMRSSEVRQPVKVSQ